MDILADRKASSRVDGVVLFNSAVIQPNYRFSIGYVVQVSLESWHHDLCGVMATLIAVIYFQPFFCFLKYSTGN